MKPARTIPCPDCEGGRVPVRVCGHTGCCPCSTGEGECETCRGEGRVVAQCSACWEALTVDDDGDDGDVCGECREAWEAA